MTEAIPDSISVGSLLCVLIIVASHTSFCLVVARGGDDVSVDYQSRRSAAICSGVRTIFFDDGAVVVAAG